VTPDLPDHPYNPDDHGYIALVEPGDEQRELDDIDMPRLTDIMWKPHIWFRFGSYLNPNQNPAYTSTVHIFRLARLMPS
jgi:hypothetical protein